MRGLFPALFLDQVTAARPEDQGRGAYGCMRGAADFNRHRPRRRTIQ